MYKEATRLKLRFETSKGLLSVEQLWSLNLDELDSLAVKIDDEYKNSGKKSYLIKKTSKDKILKLKSDILVDILTTKVEENEVARNTLEDKEHNQKILRLIADKQDEELKGKSLKELQALLK